MFSRRNTLGGWTAAFVGIAMLAGAQGERPVPGTVAASGGLPSTISYSLQDGLIVVKARIGTGVPQDAVLATGLPLSLINPDLATKQSIPSQGVFDLPTLGGPARVLSSRPQQFTIGRLMVDNVPIGIFDLYT